jgi:hypothetical protein
MAVNIKLKRSAVPGRVPTTSSLELGEIALNTYDGKAYMLRQVGTTESVVELATTSGSVATASYAFYAQNAGFATNASYATSAGTAATASHADYAAIASLAWRWRTGSQNHRIRRLNELRYCHHS